MSAVCDNSENIYSQRVLPPLTHRRRYDGAHQAPDVRAGDPIFEVGMPEGSRRPKGEDAGHGLQTGAKGLPHAACEKNTAAEPCLLTAPAEALLALSNVGWPSALDER
jgi:hypothetical protein